MKTAISLPDAVFEQAEALAQQLGGVGAVSFIQKP